MPQERWDVEAIYATEAEPGRSYARFGAFLQARWDFRAVSHCHLDKSTWTLCWGCASFPMRVFGFNAIAGLEYNSAA